MASREDPTAQGRSWPVGALGRLRGSREARGALGRLAMALGRWRGGGSEEAGGL